MNKTNIIKKNSKAELSETTIGIIIILVIILIGLAIFFDSYLLLGFINL